MREKAKNKYRVHYLLNSLMLLGSVILVLSKNVSYSFVEYTKSGDFSAHHCHKQLLYIINIFSNYTKSAQYVPKDKEKGESVRDFSHVQNINEFEIWYFDLVEKVLDFVNKKSNNSSREIFKKVKKYICNNLSDEPSLDSIVEIVI